MLELLLTPGLLILLGLILLLVWLLLGFAAGVPGVALFAAGAQLLAGIGYAYGDCSYKDWLYLCRLLHRT